jgi:Cd2+/Zn2+-exporting ATPase/Cu+-exporting ATPase
MDPSVNHIPGEPEQHGVFDWIVGLRIGLVVLAAGGAWIDGPPRSVSIVTVWVVALVIGGWPVFKEAVENLMARRMTMELSMSLAIVAAAAIGEFFTALVITLFVLWAEVLEHMTVARGRRAIGDLLALLPRAVKVRRAAGVCEAPTDEVRAGEAVLVDPGGLVPVDGVVLHGHSFIDQSRITGESQPAEKMPGSIVYAGTVNQSGALEIRVDRVGRNTSYGKIIEVVEHAEESRAPVQRMADRLAGYLVYFALGAAALTFLASRDLRSTIAVVIVAGACGIAVGTPIALLGAIGRAAHLGAIVKGGRPLETLGRVDTVVFDKTGTLTLGRPEVQSVVPLAGVPASTVLSAAASAESRSEHPLGKAIVSRAKTLGSEIREPAQFIYTPGRGVVSVVEGARILVGNRALMAANNVALPPIAEDVASSEVLVARDGEMLGAIAVGDQVRGEAEPAVRALARMKIRTVLLTGDIKPVAQMVGQQVNITQVEAELLP